MNILQNINIEINDDKPHCYEQMIQIMKQMQAVWNIKKTVA